MLGVRLVRTLLAVLDEHGRLVGGALVQLLAGPGDVPTPGLTRAGEHRALAVRTLLAVAVRAVELGTTRLAGALLDMQGQVLHGAFGAADHLREVAARPVLGAVEADMLVAADRLLTDAELLELEATRADGLAERRLVGALVGRDERHDVGVLRLDAHHLRRVLRVRREGEQGDAGGEQGDASNRFHMDILRWLRLAFCQLTHECVRCESRSIKTQK